MSRADVDARVEALVKGLKEFRNGSKGEQDDVMDYLVGKYLNEGERNRCNLFVVFMAGMIIDAERYGSYLQTRIPFKMHSQ
jgi:hypothetical protein